MHPFKFVTTFLFVTAIVAAPMKSTKRVDLCGVDDEACSGLVEKRADLCGVDDEACSGLVEKRVDLCGVDDEACSGVTDPKFSLIDMQISAAGKTIGKSNFEEI
ncbi:hypothetical protein V8E51_019371 [Hyaloscypha variabilis]